MARLFMLLLNVSFCDTTFPLVLSHGSESRYALKRYTTHQILRSQANRSKLPPMKKCLYARPTKKDMKAWTLAEHTHKCQKVKEKSHARRHVLKMPRDSTSVLWLIASRVQRAVVPPSLLPHQHREAARGCWELQATIPIRHY